MSIGRMAQELSLFATHEWPQVSMLALRNFEAYMLAICKALEVLHGLHEVS